MKRIILQGWLFSKLSYFLRLILVLTKNKWMIHFNTRASGKKNPFLCRSLHEGGLRPTPEGSCSSLAQESTTQNKGMRSQVCNLATRDRDVSVSPWLWVASQPSMAGLGSERIPKVAKHLHATFTPYPSWPLSLISSLSNLFWFCLPALMMGHNPETKW